GEVEQGGVPARPAIDHVRLAVTRVERVVPGLAVEGVDSRLRHIGRGQGPEFVVSVATERLVNALVGEDDVPAGPSVLLVVTFSSCHQVVAGVAERLVVAVPAEQQVSALTAGEGVVTRPAELP